jgi:hypothetical protein
MATGLAHSTWAAAEEPAIVGPKSGSFAEKLAAKEVRRYIYLRTGRLLPLCDAPPAGADRTLIVVGNKGQALVREISAAAKLTDAVERLAAEQYMLKTIDRPDGGKVLLIAGGDCAGTLYGAYRLAEHLGVRFYMHGDVVPDELSPLALPRLDETGKPLFALRGIQPFHDFPEGPDWWNGDDYKAILGQLPKMRMNFFGLHTYPQGGVGPEPLVWIGRPAEVGPQGKVKASYPSRHFTAGNVTGAWGYRPAKTGQYAFGADALFDRDDYGADYMNGTYPWNKMSADECNRLFDQMGDVLHDAFSFARRVGIKTCLGTETPLEIPDQVKQRLKAAGRNPADPAVVQELYEGIFQRIAKTHPADYYWLWTPEGWTWSGCTEAQIKATQADFRAALAALEKVKPCITLATCGWVLGPPQTPALFDDTLPKIMPMSCISRTVGNSPVEPGFRDVHGRPKWSIPWMEDDPGLTMPQLWAGRMRRDAADSLAYGCTGLMGIHWRTRILGPNVSALAQAAWDQRGWNPDFGKHPDLSPANLPKKPAGSDKPRYLSTADFYADWARAQFGPQASRAIAAIFSRLDGHLPRPADWVTGPGSIRPDEAAWQTVQGSYAFVGELAALRPQIVGPGNLERFDYWFNNFRYLRSIGHVRCVWARFASAMAKVRAEKNADLRKKLARELALPLRKELVTAFGELHKHLLATVSTPGELGNVCNWQQQTLPVVLTDPGRELASLLGEALPADAQPSRQYAGPPRIMVPTVRTGILAGESLKLTVLLPGVEPRQAALYWRPLGSGEFALVPLVHAARSVYHVSLPPEATKADLEYYIRVEDGKGTVLNYPATAPRLNQTVVVAE